MIMSAHAKDDIFFPSLTIKNESKHILFMRGFSEWHRPTMSVLFDVQPGKEYQAIEVPSNLYFVQVDKNFDSVKESQRFEGSVPKSLPVPGDYGSDKPWCLIDTKKQFREGAWENDPSGHEPFWVSPVETPLISAQDIEAAQKARRGIVFTIKEGSSQMFIARVNYVNVTPQYTIDDSTQPGFLESMYERMRIFWRSLFGRS
jgi:hypothetical protein